LKEVMTEGIEIVAPTAPAQEPPPPAADDVQSLGSDDSATVESSNNSGRRRGIVKVALATVLSLALARSPVGAGGAIEGAGDVDYDALCPITRRGGLVSDEEKTLNVHLVPHTHDDTGNHQALDICLLLRSLIRVTNKHFARYTTTPVSTTQGG